MPEQQFADGFSRAAATYDMVGPRHFEYFARRLVEFVGVRRGESVLDAATGTGEVLLLATNRVGRSGHVLGVDVSTAMLDRAAAMVREHGILNVDLKPGR